MLIPHGRQFITGPTTHRQPIVYWTYNGWATFSAVTYPMLEDANKRVSQLIDCGYVFATNPEVVAARIMAELELT